MLNDEIVPFLLKWLPPDYLYFILHTIICGLRVSGALGHSATERLAWDSLRVRWSHGKCSLGWRLRRRNSDTLIHLPALSLMRLLPMLGLTRSGAVFRLFTSVTLLRSFIWTSIETALFRIGVDVAFDFNSMWFITLLQKIPRLFDKRGCEYRRNNKTDDITLRCELPPNWMREYLRSNRSTNAFGGW